MSAPTRPGAFEIPTHRISLRLLERAAAEARVSTSFWCQIHEAARRMRDRIAGLRSVPVSLMGEEGADASR